MAFVQGKCPICGASVRVPDDTEKCHCPNCGEEALTSAAIAFAKDGGSAQGDATNSVLAQWNTSIGAIAAGEIIGLVVLYAFTLVGGADLAASNLLLGIYYGVCALYSFIVYPSFFKKNPLVRSANAISFCNGFFGTFMLGPLFCYNLKKGHKGISNIVWGILLAGLAFNYLTSVA